MDKNNPLYILVHGTDVSWQRVRDQAKSVEWYHSNGPELGGHPQGPFPLSSLGFRSGYQAICTGGKNYRRRNDTDMGVHCNQVVNGISMNLQSLACCIGFDGDIEYPHPDDERNARAQIQEWQAKYNIPNENVKFHREFAPWKTCPGSLIKQDWIDNLLKKEAVVKPPEQCEKQNALIELQKHEITVRDQVIKVLIDILRKFKII